jgi:ribosomal protein S18 acetylase RimI-like enzyme
MDISSLSGLPYSVSVGRFTVRRARPEDAAAIAGYNAAMALETENLELDRERLLAGVRRVLADAAKGFYLVAEDSGRVAGQLMITYEWSDWRNADFWWIQSVYVHPEARRGGVFAALYAEAERLARDTGACGLRLYVERDNERAQRIYESKGMARTAYEMFEIDFVLGRGH